MNDADIETAELAEAGDMAAAGVCSLCEDVLDPLHPKWKDTRWPRTTIRICATCVGAIRWVDGHVGWQHVAEADHPAVPSYRETTAAEYAESLGPVDPQLPYHVFCLNDR